MEGFYSGEKEVIIILRFLFFWEEDLSFLGEIPEEIRVKDFEKG